jgi:hypothetical protein
MTITAYQDGVIAYDSNVLVSLWLQVRSAK